MTRILAWLAAFLAIAAGIAIATHYATTPSNAPEQARGPLEGQVLSTQRELPFSLSKCLKRLVGDTGIEPVTPPV